jgi:hypothetical protein
MADQSGGLLARQPPKGEVLTSGQANTRTCFPIRDNCESVVFTTDFFVNLASVSCGGNNVGTLSGEQVR